MCGQVADQEAEVSPLQTGHPSTLQGPARGLFRVGVLALLLVLETKHRAMHNKYENVNCVSLSTNLPAIFAC